MKSAMLAMLGTVGVILVGLVVWVLMWWSAETKEASLRALHEKQKDVNLANFDKVWKVIQQQANVADAERESFRKTYTEIMTATKGVAGNGQLASFFTQAKIDINSDLFKQLMTTIEAQREDFFTNQQKLLDIERQHTVLRTTRPGMWFVGNVPPLVSPLVTSERAEEAFATGHENDVELFKN